MSTTVEVIGLKQAVAALTRMANDSDFSGKVINPPVRAAMKTFATAIRAITPRQALAKAKKMRSYPRFANFPRLYQRIGSKFKASAKRREAEGKAGVNVGFRKNTLAPQGTWTALGTRDRWLKAHHTAGWFGPHGRKVYKVTKQGVIHGRGYRGVNRAMGYVPRAVAGVSASVITTAEQETRSRFLKESTAENGSPFKR